MPSVIDIHPHIVSPDTVRYPLAPLGGVQSAWSRERPTTFEMLLDEMDKAGVAKAAIVQASTAYGHDNSYVADAVAACPDRFTGVFSVDVLAPDAVERIKYWLDLGLSGLRLFTTGSTMPGQATWFDDPRSFPAWDYVEKNRIPVCMQMIAEGFPKLRALMERFPRTRITLDHLARPKLVDGPPYGADAALFGLARYDTVFLKVTPFNVSVPDWGKATPESFFGKLVQTFGAERIAWGSNFPNSPGTLKEILTAARTAFAFASRADQDWIFGKTAQKLYPNLAV